MIGSIEEENVQANEIVKKEDKRKQETGIKKWCLMFSETILFVKKRRNTTPQRNRFLLNSICGTMGKQKTPP